MGMKWVKSSIIHLGLMCMICFTVTLQQDACIVPNVRIDISFPENDLNSTLSAIPVYSQVVLTSPNELFNVTVEKDYYDFDYKYPFKDYFSVSYFNGFYRVNMIRGIDRDGATSGTEDDRNILQYQMGCQSTSESTKFFIVLKIVITDINDNTPQFLNPPYAVEVNELTPIGVTVYRSISATDKDEGPNSQIVYILSDDTTTQFKNGTKYFSLPSEQEGFINVKGFLDFESMYNVTRDATKTFYIINVIARDNPANPSQRRSNMTTLTVKILDGDDLGPEFVYDSCILSYEQVYPFCIRPKYTTTLLSGTNQEVELKFQPVPTNPSNTDNINIIMQDRDTLNSPVICVIQNTEPAGYTDYFTATAIQIGASKQYRCRIVKKAGSVLTRSVVSSLELIIVAIEQSFNRREEYAIVSVQITPTNLYPPTITPSNGVGYIYENSPVLTLVSDSISITNAFKLTFQDPDLQASEVKSYNFVLGDNVGSTDSSAFSVLTVNNEARLYLNTAVNYESKNSYVFLVTTQGMTGAKIYATATVTVSVLDTNDNTPVIGQYSATVTVLETVAIGSTLSNFTATDADGTSPNNRIEYKVQSVSPNSGSNLFYVGEKSAILTVASSLQADRTVNTYTVTVIAFDLGTPSLTATGIVTVTVKRNTTPPTCSSTRAKAGFLLIFSAAAHIIVCNRYLIA